MARTNKTDAGKYNQPSQIQKLVTRTDDAQGGNTTGNSWTTVCSPKVRLYSLPYGRGSLRPFQYGQLYPNARHWAEMRYRSSTPIDGTMTIVINGRRLQILDAIDLEMEPVTILLPLTEYQSQGTAKVS